MNSLNSLISYNELLKLVASGVVEGTKPEDVNAASIDIHLGRFLLIEQITDGCKYPGHPDVVSLRKRDSLKLGRHDLVEQGPYIIKPGEFLLASSEEVFNLPNNIAAEYKLKSSLARAGLDHLNAGWCDPGWHGSVLTLELRNLTTYHYLELRHGLPIGQMIFFRCEEVPEKGSYATKGSYNGDRTVQGVKSREADKDAN